MKEPRLQLGNPCYSRRLGKDSAMEKCEERAISRDIKTAVVASFRVFDAAPSPTSALPGDLLERHAVVLG